jgi:hypothetical protein
VTAGYLAGQREHLGRVVRDAWVQWAVEQEAPKPSWLISWAELDDGQRDVDMRIGEAVASEVLEAAGKLVIWNRCATCDAVEARAEAAEAKLAAIRQETGNFPAGYGTSEVQDLANNIRKILDDPEAGQP